MVPGEMVKGNAIKFKVTMFPTRKPGMNTIMVRQMQRDNLVIV